MTIFNRLLTAPPPKRERATSDPHFRWALTADLQRLAEIEAESFPVPWSEHEFLRFHKEPQSTVIRVLEIDSHVVGYAAYRLQRSSVFLANLAVARNYRRLGLGSRLIEDVELRCRNSGDRKAIRTLISEWNTPAHLFLRSTGFRALGVIRAWYDDTPEGEPWDAYEFRRELFETEQTVEYGQGIARERQM